MSTQFLQELNGNNTGHFKTFLTGLQTTEPIIAWYPSARADFRNFIFLSSGYAALNFKDEKWTAPDLFIYTDYDSAFLQDLFPANLMKHFTEPLPFFTALLREMADIDGHFLYNDDRTSVRVMQFEKLPPLSIAPYDVKAQHELVTLDVDNNPKRDVYFLKLDIWSNKYGSSTVNLIYINIVNEIFANKLVQSAVKISHITKVRYGSAFGGARAIGAYLKNILKPLNVNYFISDPRLEVDDDRLPGRLYSSLRKGRTSAALVPFHTVKGESWSYHGDVSFYKVVNQ